MLKTLVRDKLTYYFPVLLVLVNVLNKLPCLTAQDIALDEPFSIYHAQFPVREIIEQLKGYNNPPLFELVLHYWIGVFGVSPLSVRMLPFIFACLAPLALYYFAKRNFAFAPAAAGALIFSSCNLLVFYSHDCRVYTLFALLTILSMHLYLRLLLPEGKKITRTILFVVVNCLLMYAHYFGAFVLLIQGLHLIIFNKEQLKEFLLYYAVVFLLYLPHLYPLLLRMDESVSNGTWLKPPAGIESLYTMLWSFSNYPLTTVACIVTLMAAAVKFLMRGGGSADGKTAKNRLVLLWFALPFLGMFVISFWVPMYISRYLIFALPAYCLMLALAVDYLLGKNTELPFAWKWRNPALLLLVVAFAATLEPDPDKKQPVSKTIAAVHTYKSPNTVLLVTPAHFLPVFAYHYKQEAFCAVGDNKEYFLMDSLLRAENIYHLQSAADLSLLTHYPDKEVLLLALGKERNGPEDPVCKGLSVNYTLQWKKHMGNDWYLSGYKGRAGE